MRQGGTDTLMHPSDLPYYTKLHPGRVLQRQLIALQKPFSEVRQRQQALYHMLAILGKLQASMNNCWEVLHTCWGSVAAVFSQLLHWARSTEDLGCSDCISLRLICQSCYSCCIKLVVFASATCVCVT